MVLSGSHTKPGWSVRAPLALEPGLQPAHVQVRVMVVSGSCSGEGEGFRFRFVSPSRSGDGGAGVRRGRGEGSGGFFFFGGGGGVGGLGGWGVGAWGRGGVGALGRWGVGALGRWGGGCVGTSTLPARAVRREESHSATTVELFEGLRQSCWTMWARVQKREVKGVAAITGLTKRGTPPFYVRICQSNHTSLLSEPFTTFSPI